MKLGIFPWIMTTALWPFVPSSFWAPKGGKGLLATLLHKTLLWSAYLVWWTNSFIFEEDGENFSTDANNGDAVPTLSSKTLTKPLHSYRQMGPAHWDALFNLDANGVVYVVPDESKGAAAAVTVDGAATSLLSAKQRRQQSKKKKKKTPEGEDISSSAGTTPPPPPTPSPSSSFYWGTAMSSTDVVAAVTSRTKVRWHLKRGVVACRDLFVAYMVVWSAMLFANAGWGWKCQNTFEWFSPTVGKWANKTCKSDLQWYGRTKGLILAASRGH